MGKLKFAMICSSNQNRSMEAHALLQEKGLQVASFGTGSKVRLPGETMHTPNVYDFGTPYEDILKDLKSKAEEHYKKRGLLRMLERNMAIKTAPERWQTALTGKNITEEKWACREEYDVVCTFEERVMDQVTDDMASRRNSGIRPVLIVNLDVQDNHEEAAQAAPLALHLCEMMDQADDVFEEADTIIDEFSRETQRPLLHDICYY